jgi:hypothetical protein
VFLGESGNVKNSADVLAGVVSAWCVVETCAEIWPSLI